MHASIPANSWRHRPFLFNNQRLLFSLSSYLACVATLGIAFEASMPRPWWALLTVYVTAQPLSGALRPKVSYRLVGIVLGATVAVLLVPNLQNAPEILVPALAAWTGFSIYLAIHDRTPRAFLFQMSAFSAAIIGFPYLDDPGNIFIIAVDRVEEMTVAIVCVTIVHSLLQPWSIKPVISVRAKTFLADAISWSDGAFDLRHNTLAYGKRQRLAADVTELGIIAIHLPFDTSGGVRTKALVYALQRRLAALIPLASATAQRLQLLGGREQVTPDIKDLIDRVREWLKNSDNESIDDEAAYGLELIGRARDLSLAYGRRSDWTSLLSASLTERMAEFLEAVRDARRLVGALNDAPGNYSDISLNENSPPIARDHALAILAGLATAAAIILYCLVWIFLAWPTGSATAAFAALITCSFAAQEDPAPIIGRYLGATLMTFPIAAIGMFVLLPTVDGYLMLSVALAPVLIGIGYIQADPERSSIALPMFSSLIVGLGFVASFQPDFESFVNTAVAQVMGIVITIAVARLFRSVGVDWSARRLIRLQWRELEDLATSRGEPDFAGWTALSLDRIGQISARLALTSQSNALHAADGLADIRVGRNILHLRRAAEIAHGAALDALNRLLSEVGNLFRMRQHVGTELPPTPEILSALDDAVAAIQTIEHDARRHQALLATVGMRCNLFPNERHLEVSTA
jgi:uncharacterized membrane protein YccC